MHQNRIDHLTGESQVQDEGREVVFCPRSLRAPPEAQSDSTVDEALAAQRRCWVLPPSEPRDGDGTAKPFVDPEMQACDLGERCEGRASASSMPRKSQGRERLSRSDKAPNRQSSVSSDRSRRSGIAGKSPSNGRGPSVNAASSRQAEPQDGPMLSARRRNGGAATLTATAVSRSGPGASARTNPGTVSTPKQTRSRSQEVSSRARNAPSGAEPVVPISQLRRVEAQLESFRTRNAALEGEVAGLRAEAQAVKQDLDDEILRLREELQHKDMQLQQREELKKRDVTSVEQSKALQTILNSCRAVPQTGSMSLPAAVVALSHSAPAAVSLSTPPARMATPRTTPPQVAAPPMYAVASPGLQMRQLRGEPAVVSFAPGANAAFANVNLQRLAPRQVWAHTPTNPACA